MVKARIYKIAVSGAFLLFMTGMFGDLSLSETVVPHQHTWELYTETSATCETDGVQVFSCACGEMDAVKTEKLEHQIAMLEGKQATCKQTSWAEYEGCILCGEGEKVELPVREHELIEHDAQEPTCQTPGFAEYETCAHCEYTTYQEIPTIEHNFTEEVISEPTCEEDGLTLRICLDCSVTYSDIVKSRGHVWDEGIITLDSIVYTCQKCFATKTEDMGHEHNYTIKHIIQNATCQTDGKQTLSCVCGNSITQTITAGHTYENGICTRCGTLDEGVVVSPPPTFGEGNGGIENNNPEQGGENNNPEQGGVSGTTSTLPTGVVFYELNDDKTAYICIGTSDVNCSEIIIADTYNGLPVTEIAAQTFMYMYRLNRVTIGANIEKVDRYVFYDCPNLIEVYNRSSLSEKEIGYLPYCESARIYTQEFQSALTYNNGFVTYNEGGECYLVGYTGTATQVTIPTGVTYLCRRVFDGSAVTKITISESVKTIAYGAFQNIPLVEAVFENKKGWKCDDMELTVASLSDVELAARFLTTEYVNFLWKRS